MTFWTRLRLACHVSVAVIALLALLVTFLTPPASALHPATPTPPATNPSNSPRPPGGTTGL